MTIIFIDTEKEDEMHACVKMSKETAAGAVFTLHDCTATYMLVPWLTACLSLGERCTTISCHKKIDGLYNCQNPTGDPHQDE